ncbi:conserved membrane protein of unknown function [Tenacibaculum sp. 190524A02b]
MKNTKNITFLSYFFKTLWCVTVLLTIYLFGWITLLFFSINSLISKNYTFWNFILPNITTIVLVFFYSKELLLGNQQSSKSKNYRSLLLYFVIISLLIYIQFPLALELLNLFNSSYYDWVIILPLIIILTRYFGILLNRIQQLY